MEKIETSMSGIEDKLLKKISAFEKNVSGAISNIEGRLESLEVQFPNHYPMVRNFCNACKIVARFLPDSFFSFL